MNPKKKILSTALATLLCLGVASGQTTAIDQNAAPKPVDTIKLSPFIVTADKDEGYYASETLGGTRLRSDTKDLAASISVITKQLMDDLGAHSYAELLPYTVSTEVGGLFGNIAGEASGTFFGQGVPTSTQRQQARPRTRVRGLAPADTTRDYSLSRIPIDSYNTDRFAVQRGANAMLFGLGSPAGIIDAQTIVAGFANKNKLELGTDDNGSLRSSVDFNRVIIDDKLAIRVAGLYKDQEFTQKPTYEEDRRGFLTLTYKPLKYTTIKASAEVGEIKASRPDTITPINAMDRAWFDAGMPLATAAQYANPTGNAAGLLTFPFAALSQLNATVAGRVYVNSSDRNPYTGTLVRHNNFHHSGLGAQLPVSDPFGNFIRVSTASYRSQDLQGAPGQNSPADLFSHQRSEEQGFLDFNNVDMEHIKVFAAERSKEKFEAYDFNFEQLFLQDVAGQSAGINLSYHNEKYKAQLYDGQWDGIMSAIMIDLNPFIPLPDPSNASNTLRAANPNVGRPFVINWTPEEQNDELEEKSIRANVFYEIDPTKGKSSWLGKQLFTASAARQDSFASHNQDVFAMTPIAGNQALPKTFLDIFFNSGGANGPRPMSISYVGPSVLSATSYSGLKVTDSAAPVFLRNGDQIEYTVWDGVTQKWVKLTARISQGLRKIAMSLNKNESIAVIHQGRFLKDGLITTTGWRKDSVDLNVADIGPEGNTGNFNANQFRDRKMKLLASNTTRIFTYGAVLHVNKFVKLPSGMDLSLAYNSAENFDPSAVRFTALGKTLDSPSGLTKELSVRLGLMNNKIHIALTRYQTDLTGATVGTPLGNVDVIIDRMLIDRAGEYLGEARIQNNAGFTAVADSLVATAEKFITAAQTQPLALSKMSYTRIDRFTVSTQDIVNSTATADLIGKGWELEVSTNPIRGLNVGFNLANQEVVRANFGSQFLDEWNSMTPSFTPLFGILQNAALEANALKGTPAPVGSLTVRDRFNGFDSQFKQMELANGTVNTEVQKWRANLFANYVFQSNGLLKGFGVGGALRYQSGATIGYHSTTFTNAVGTKLAVADLNKPILTPDVTQGDVWFSYRRKLSENLNLKLQLNVRNAIRGPKLLGARAQPDSPYTDIAQARLTLPTSYMFSSTLEF